MLQMLGMGGGDSQVGPGPGQLLGSVPTGHDRSPYDRVPLCARRKDDGPGRGTGVTGQQSPPAIMSRISCPAQHFSEVARVRLR
jgi:hypothetical protein